ncbi:MAG TPA: glycosyltransferase [Solirubrobacteraceae bacterium]
MIGRGLKRALDWRFGAIAARLDGLYGRVDDLDRRQELIVGRLDQLTAMLDQLRGPAAQMSQTAEHASATHALLEQRLQPALRAILDEQAENRRRLYRLRADPGYDEPFTDPDPLVSITVATIGRSALLDRALPSLLGQTHAHLEVIVVGDAASPDVAKAVLAGGDSRVRYANLSQRIVAHEDPRRHWLAGSTMARNEAARRAKGSWLVHFDDDDRLRPDAIASLLELAREQRAEVVYGGFEEHRPDGASSVGIGFPPRLGCFSWAGALVHGGLRFFERELVAADLEMPGDMYLLERMLRAGVRFAPLEEIVLDYFPSTLWESQRPPR